MRRVASAALLAITIGLGAHSPAQGQVCTFACPPDPMMPAGAAITPLGGFILGSVATAAIAPIIGTIVLGREMTPNEVYRSTLISFLGPVGWVLGNQFFPDAPGGGNPPMKSPQRHGRNINIPPAGETHFVPNEVLVEFDAGTSARYLDTLLRSLQLTPIESHTFVLTGRTVQLLRIDGSRSVPDTLRAFSRFGRIAAAQANFTFLDRKSTR